MSPSVDLGLLVARLGLGLTMFFAHGLMKIQNFSSLSERFLDFLGIGSTMSLILAISAEVGGALLVAVGLFTRLGAFLLINTMAVAFFVAHAADPFARKELPFIFLIGFIVLFIAGPGRYSLQNVFKINSESRIPFVAWLLK